jgi:hypothetical protein
MVASHGRPDAPSAEVPKLGIARRLLPWVTAFVSAATASFAMSATALAECPYLPPYPAATEAAPSAQEIIVGTVIENVNGQYADFRLRIDHVIRGPARIGEVRRITSLFPGWPLARTTDGTVIAPCQPIYASAGDVVALALGAVAPDGRTRYNAVSWISGTAVLRQPGEFEVTTIARLKAAAQLPSTDTTAADGESREDRSLQGLVTFAAAVLAALILVGRPRAAIARR